VRINPYLSFDGQCQETTMITGRWGKPSEVLLDLVVEGDGSIRGVANPGRQDAPIRRGHFDASSGAVTLEDRSGRLIGFTWGKPRDGEFEGELSKIYLRWEYHGLGLGRRMMAETARRFVERGIHSFILFAELSNPTLAFYDRMGGERLLDDRGQFGGSYGWRDVRTLIS
jgi:ribosomal protein S18 acetylase RimI-like enzyme